MTSSIVPWKTASSAFSLGVNSEGWNLATTSNDDVSPRTFVTEVTFAEPFTGAPLVQASLAGFDIDQRDSARVSVAVTQVTPTGFTLAVTTWRETRVYGVEITWLALGH
ncbi:MAG TPA: H-type lectin domain-containing protein [Chthoniobacterales bacterium]|jgi:hypothetical protein